MKRLDNKNVIITGAAGGIGRAACRKFTEEGARVLATDLASDVAGELRALGNGSIDYVRADVATTEGQQAIVAGAKAWLGDRVDVLYNNHGIILGKPFLETTPEDWDRVHDVDLKSVFFLSQRIVPLMPRGSCILNMSSIGGLVAVGNMTAYSAAKGGLAMLSRGMALDLTERGIRVNAIAPGAVDTPMPRSFMKGLSSEEQKQAGQSMGDRHMLKRFGEAHEIASVAAFIASDEASFMTGSVVAVDGGWTAF